MCSLLLLDDVVYFVVSLSLCHVQLLWPHVLSYQAPLSFSVSQSWLRLMSTELVMLLSIDVSYIKTHNAKECSNYCTVALISQASKVMLKILQARLQQYVNHELPDVQAHSGKGRGTRDQIANICWIMEKAREFQKNIYFCFTTMTKPLTVWITINCG